MVRGTYTSIITLNVNGLNALLKDTDWLKGYKNKTHIYVLSTRNPLQTLRHIYTESERMAKYIPYKWKANEIWRSNPHIRQNRP